MAPRPSRNGKRMMAAILLSYLLAVAFIYVMQRQMMYVPSQEFPVPAIAGVPDMAPVTVTTTDGLKLKALYKAPESPDRPVIVLFHGNGGSISIRGYRARDFIDHGGYGYLLAEYRGYGANPGKPNEQGLYNDARAYLDWLIKEQNISQERIVLYGESLGTGVATKMALEYPRVRALILEAPYTTMQAVAQRHMAWLPAYWLVRDRYNNIDNIRTVTAPVMILHGRKDIVVPYSHGVKVFEKAQAQKRFEDFPQAGHIDLHDYEAGGKVRDFLDSLPPPDRTTRKDPTP